MCRIPLAAMLLTVVVAGLPASYAAQGICRPEGDLDRDGRVTTVDAMLVILQSLDLTDLSACQQSIADVFPSPDAADGVITTVDVLCTVARALGSPSCLGRTPYEQTAFEDLFADSRLVLEGSSEDEYLIRRQASGQFIIEVPEAASCLRRRRD